MSKTEYTAEEQDILNEMAQNRAMDVDKVANFLVSHKGDMSLNRKLRRDLEVDNHLPDARLDKMNDKVRGNKEIIERFGRFPHRNIILGRVSTAEEIVFLNEPNSFF